ncbi:MAG TPA: GNAT family protein [Ignavibacteriaceae bacterium]|nr:GNAT family protein [Ignavibacteriaceae bacterium]
MKIKVNSQIYLTQVTKADKTILIKLLNDKDIYKNTLKIPFPYKEKDADDWISHVESLKKEIGVLRNWIIKNKNNELIGGISFHNKYGIHSHKDEIGYWLGKPFWNKGIMTDVVNKICSIGFTDFNLKRIEALVFSFNEPSKKVLEKAGFMLEGTMKKFYYKNYKFIDADIYARLI